MLIHNIERALHLYYASFLVVGQYFLDVYANNNPVKTNELVQSITDFVLRNKSLEFML